MEQEQRTYPGKLERTPEFWSSIVSQVDKSVRSVDEKLGKALGSERWQIDFSCTRSNRISPRILLLQNRRLRIEFPEEFFLWTDEAAQFMHGDVPYRNALSICQARPDEDHSRLFHQLWCLWIAHHEVSHFLCGHLFHLSVTEFVELGAIGGKPFPHEMRLLREAMEVDADINAAKLFFADIGRLSASQAWDDFYGLNDCSVLLMQDLALIFLPLFLEISHSESSDASRRVHPSAFHRLVLFQLFGLNAYRKEVHSSVEQHLGGYGAGLKKAIELLIHLDGTMLREKPAEPDFVSHKRALLSVQMERKRLVKFPDDWLKK
ncbi:hypothetical protein [Ahniella affigens]|uniref:hypothetical protein n=1 Tax=Ahniella affigens TaxID=2021234 RepID=UPI0011B27548|nr:hypothetical protein [Ahniella affigens]